VVFLLRLTVWKFKMGMLVAGNCNAAILAAYYPPGSGSWVGISEMLV